MLFVVPTQSIQSNPKSCTSTHNPTLIPIYYSSRGDASLFLQRQLETSPRLLPCWLGAYIVCEYLHEYLLEKENPILIGCVKSGFDLTYPN